MKINSLVVVVALLSVACQNGDKSSETARDPTVRSPIEGNWELVENRVNGGVSKSSRLQQFNVFHDGFYSFIMYKPDGSFYASAAGPHTVTGTSIKKRYAIALTLPGSVHPTGRSGSWKAIRLSSSASKKSLTETAKT